MKIPGQTRDSVSDTSQQEAPDSTASSQPTHIGPWKILEIRGVNKTRILVIRRRIELSDGNRRYERLSSSRYHHLRKDLGKLKEFVWRLNGSSTRTSLEEHADLWKICGEVRRNQKRVLVIRRRVIDTNGTLYYQRYPSSEYAHLRDDLEKLKEFVWCLNGNRTPPHLYEIDHPLITRPLLEEYEKFLRVQIPTLEKSKNAMSYLVRYFIRFYAEKLGYQEIKDWHRNQTLWAQALLNECRDPSLNFESIKLWEKDRIPAPITIKMIIYNANRFIRWLHGRYPKKVPLLQFEPISKAVYSSLGARRELNGLVRQKRFVRDEDWTEIQKRARPTPINGQINLAYYFGLRRAETMGLGLENVRVGCLIVDKQLVENPASGPVFDILKTKRIRKIPYWFSGPEEAYHWVQEANRNLMFPDTFSKLWEELMVDLEMEYQLHDLRRTWITRSFRVPDVLPTDIQLAAGYRSFETTSRYKLDDRILDERPYIPETGT